MAPRGSDIGSASPGGQYTNPDVCPAHDHALWEPASLYALQYTNEHVPTCSADSNSLAICGGCADTGECWAPISRAVIPTIGIEGDKLSCVRRALLSQNTQHNSTALAGASSTAR